MKKLIHFGFLFLMFISYANALSVHNSAISTKQISWQSTFNTDIPSGAWEALLYKEDGQYSGSRVLANVGYYIPKHMHSYSNEYITVISGSVKMECWENNN